MINTKIIYKILGSLLFIEVALMTGGLVMALVHKEDDVPAFIISVVITLMAGIVLRYKGHDADNNLSRRDAYLVVTLAWIVFSLFGTMPYMVGGYIDNFTDAFFETMSGFSTTGATILNDVEHLPHGILFWRSLTQWIGGLGIVFFTIALLPSMVGGSTKIFAAEATGPIKAKLHPRLSMSAKWIWAVYITITIACMGSYLLCGMNWYEALNFSMTSTATGGFAIYNDSISHFHSPLIEYVATFFCFLSGVNFTLLYFSVSKLKFGDLFRNAEFKFYVFAVTASTLLIAYCLSTHNGYDVEHALRSSLFQVVAFITTTGYFNDDAGSWFHVTWVVLVVCMFLGANSGSTSGGFKSVRMVMIFKIIKNEFRQILHPNALLPLKINTINVPLQKRVTLLAFLASYMIILAFSTFIMATIGVESNDAISVTFSSLGNVGPALGNSIGPTDSWDSLPTLGKWIASTLMLIGRLEIFSVLIIFTPTFWKEN